MASSEFGTFTRLCKIDKVSLFFRLIRLLHKYARENLLLANIYIKDPAVTMIRRDQKIPIIWFVANVGGILGLCMGCSLVTIFEVLHHVILIFLRTSVKSVSRIHKTIRCAPKQGIMKNTIILDTLIFSCNYSQQRKHTLGLDHGGLYAVRLQYEHFRAANFIEPRKCRRHFDPHQSCTFAQKPKTRIDGRFRRLHQLQSASQPRGCPRRHREAGKLLRNLLF